MRLITLSYCCQLKIPMLYLLEHCLTDLTLCSEKNLPCAYKYSQTETFVVALYDWLGSQRYFSDNPTTIFSFYRWNGFFLFFTELSSLQYFTLQILGTRALYRKKKKFFFLFTKMSFQALDKAHTALYDFFTKDGAGCIVSKNFITRRNKRCIDTRST